MARNPVFRFKKFVVHHDRCAMKVGTDAVLLGAWVSVPSSGNVLDIGTGTGVIALMIAQRSTDLVVIDGVENAEPDAAQALENVSRSPWPTRIHIRNSRIQDFETQVRYDLIVCNPPFFINSLKPPSPERTVARHDDSLSLSDLVASVTRLLKLTGTFAVVLPPVEAQRLISLAEQAGLYRRRSLEFRTRPDRPVERVLLEFGYDELAMGSQSIVLYQSGLAWSIEYHELVREFYTINLSQQL